MLENKNKTKKAFSINDAFEDQTKKKNMNISTFIDSIRGLEINRD